MAHPQFCGVSHLFEKSLAQELISVRQNHRPFQEELPLAASCGNMDAGFSDAVGKIYSLFC